MGKYLDLKGKRFGKWLVLIRSSNRNKEIYWLCRCACGKNREVSGRDLRSGHSKSCGCSSYDFFKESRGISFENSEYNLVGKKFGKWLVIKKVSSRKGQPYWLCKCGCGKEKEIRGSSLRYSKSVGCKSCNMRERSPRQWNDPNYVKKQMKANNVQPNKLELKFESFLNDLFPNEWKYVGDGQLIINGKCPDFVNVNGKKQIIELYGDYWHQRDDPREREKVFEPFGYKTLVIWTSEMKNMSKVKEKIMEVLGNE